MSATCSTERWTFNSLGQSPCQVATALGRNCGSNAFVLAPLSAGSSYSGPSQPSEMTHCQCNTVIYNLIMACSVCQNGNIIDWIAYSTQCADTVGVFNGMIPGGIPSGIAVPTWAFTSPLGPPYQFDVSIARGVTGPDSSSQATPTRTSTHTASTSVPNFSATPGLTTENTSSTGGIGSTTTGNTISTTSAPGAMLESSTTAETESSSGTDSTTNLDGGFMTLSDPSPGSPITSDAPRKGNTAGDLGGADQAPERRNLAPIIGAAVAGAVAAGLLACLGLLIHRRRARSKNAFAPAMSESGTHPSNSPLQPFNIPHEPPHYSSDYVASEAEESEFPPAYATEDGGLALSTNRLGSRQTRRVPVQGQSKPSRNPHHGAAVYALSSVHKAVLRQ